MFTMFSEYDIIQLLSHSKDDDHRQALFVEYSQYGCASLFLQCYEYCFGRKFLPLETVQTESSNSVDDLKDCVLMNDLTKYYVNPLESPQE
ncbi:hypothetical protein M8J75_004985 [Diaphorina citri]|nr:hypothetical protein M8J75_004985 [Diaphorina citri]